MRAFAMALAMCCAGLAMPVHAASQTGPQVRLDQSSDSLRDGVRIAISALSDHGLTPADYDVDTDPKAAWLRAPAHLSGGKVDAVSVEPDWTIPRRRSDLNAVWLQTVASGHWADSLDILAPRHAEYRSLVRELSTLRQQARDEAARIPAEHTLKPGMRGEDVKILQNRLVVLGWLEDTTEVYDAATESAVARYQAANDLDSDGVVGPATRNSLNRGQADMIDQLRVNLERWRWLPDDLGRRHLRANIADFSVTAYADGQAQRTHLTIVGKPYRKTPVFSDQVEYIVFNPWWETPRSLATRDKLPLFQTDPGAVERLGFQVLDDTGAEVRNVDWNAYTAKTLPYRIRQRPGAQNALGEVKIMFPNVHNVYLHDTPARGLFAKRQRAFSSGCIRTQDPLDLSAWLLEETPDWSRERIDSTVAAGRETRVNLSEPVPVHVLYFTTTNDAGGVRYLDDIYARDAAVLRALDAKHST